MSGYEKRPEHEGWNELHFDTIMLANPFTYEVFPVDRGIADDLRALWHMGIETLACCQGEPGSDPLFPRYVMVREDPVLIERAQELLPWAVEVVGDFSSGWVALDDRRRS